ncbi:MAG: HEAT repeat domain-containing protein [Anaerolineae bacterium]|nr:HEAT repeat domain-containing protein [Anaerolineae bacterium]
MDRPLETLLDELRENSEEPDQALLCYLSGLDAADAEQVREVWTDLPEALRLELTSLLMKMAEADFTLNFDAIFRIAMEDESPDVRKIGIEGLWEDHDVRLVPRLTERLRGDESAAVRAAAAESLGRFILLGELQKIRPKPRDLAYQALLEACQGKDEALDVQRRALESLAYVCSETVIAAIREAYASPQEKLRISAVFAMGRSADTRWEQEVQQELFSINPEMRYEAARACGELQVSEAVLMLEELTEDTDTEVQEAAIWALGQIGGDKAREILERHRHTSDEAVQSAAEAALEEFEFLHGDLEDIFGHSTERVY